MSLPIPIGVWVAVALLSGVETVALAQNKTAPTKTISAHEDAKRRINLAGRQRMLIKKISKSICFFAIGVDKERSKRAISQARWLFERTMKNLRDGSKSQGLLPESHADLIEELRRESRLWVPYQAAVSSWTLGFESGNEGLYKIYQLTLPLMAEIGRTVALVEKHYARNLKLSEKVARALYVSDRQRMLSQKMSKEFCLVYKSYQRDISLKRLAGTIALFEKSHKALHDGSAEFGLPAPPGAIKDQLDRVFDVYSRMRGPLKTVAAGAKPTRAQAELVAQTNIKLLKEMDKVVYLYEWLN